MFIKQIITCKLFLCINITHAMMPIDEVKEYYDKNFKCIIIESAKFNEDACKWNNIINNIEIYLDKYKCINETILDLFPITNSKQRTTVKEVLSKNFKIIFEYFENLLPNYLYGMPNKYVKQVARKVDDVCNSFLDLVEFYEQCRRNYNRFVFCNMTQFYPKLKKLKLTVISMFAKYTSAVTSPIKMLPIAEVDESTGIFEEN